MREVSEDTLDIDSVLTNNKTKSNGKVRMNITIVVERGESESDWFILLITYRDKLGDGRLTVPNNIKLGSTRTKSIG